MNLHHVYLFLRGACRHALRSGRYAVVFAWSVRLCPVIAVPACIHLPKIGTFGDFRWPRYVPALGIQCIPYENHGCNEHDDCYNHDNALKIKRTGLSWLIHLPRKKNNANKYNIWFYFIFFVVAHMIPMSPWFPWLLIPCNWILNTWRVWYINGTIYPFPICLS